MAKKSKVSVVGVDLKTVNVVVKEAKKETSKKFCHAVCPLCAKVCSRFGRVGSKYDLMCNRCGGASSVILMVRLYE